LVHIDKAGVCAKVARLASFTILFRFYSEFIRVCSKRAVGALCLARILAVCALLTNKWVYHLLVGTVMAQRTLLAGSALGQILECTRPTFFLRHISCTLCEKARISRDHRECVWWAVKALKTFAFSFRGVTSSFAECASDTTLCSLGVVYVYERSSHTS